MKPIRYVMAAARPLNSAGQSASLVMRKSAVRIRKGAQRLNLHFGRGVSARIKMGLFGEKSRARSSISHATDTDALVCG